MWRLLYAYKKAARIFGSRIKLAVAGDPVKINYLAENSAVNRGAKLKVFVEVYKAMEWLEEEWFLLFVN